MSSAISTKGALEQSPDAPILSRDPEDAGFRPWHFFVLASLAAATVAVLMARQASPVRLILISLMIGAVGAAAAAVYRMLAPLAVHDVTLVGQRQSERARIALEKEKALVLRSIKELEFDRAMGKLAPRDFDEMSAKLRARAMMLIRQSDEGGAGYRELIERELSARLAARGRTLGDPSSAASRDAEELVVTHLADAAPAPSLEAAPASAPFFAATRPSAAAPVPCAACSTLNDVDASFCKRCGIPLEEAV